MTSEFFCSFCAQSILKSDWLNHVEKYHVGYQLKENQYHLNCGSCTYRVSVEDMEMMAEHCYRMKHPSNEILLDWTAFIAKETNRIRSIIASGVELFKDNNPTPANRCVENRAESQVEMIPSDKSSDFDESGSANLNERMESQYYGEIKEAELNFIQHPEQADLGEQDLVPDEESPICITRLHKEEIKSHRNSIRKSPLLSKDIDDAHYDEERIDHSAENIEESNESRAQRDNQARTLSEQRPYYRKTRNNFKETSVQCRKCKKTLSLLTNSSPKTCLIRHAATHTKLKLFRCLACGVESGNYQAYMNHRKKCSGAWIGTMTEDKRNVLRTELIQCFPDLDCEEQLRTSYLVGNPSTKRNSGKRVLRSQSREILDCAICSKDRINSPGAAIQHAIGHLGLQPFSCRDCSVPFSRVHHSERHSRSRGIHCSGDYDTKTTAQDLNRIKDQLDLCFPLAQWRTKLSPGTRCAGITF